MNKTLKLFHKSNATLFEWANSPVVYRTTDTWKEIYRGAERYFSTKAAMYHYYGTAKSNYHEHLTKDYVNYKKYFYVIRPMLACQWIEQKACPPPVLFDTLKDSLCDDRMRALIDDLQAQKVKMSERDKGPRINAVNDYIAAELLRFEELIPQLPDDRTPDWNPLNQLFINCIQISFH